MNGVNQTTKYDYDKLNHLTGIQDAIGNTQTFKYDKLGHLTTTTTTDHQFGGIQTSESKSNNIGWKTFTIDAKGQVFTTNYDAVLLAVGWAGAHGQPCTKQ